MQVADRCARHVTPQRWISLSLNVLSTVVPKNMRCHTTVPDRIPRVGNSGSMQSRQFVSPCFVSCSPNDGVSEALQATWYDRVSTSSQDGSCSWCASLLSVLTQKPACRSSHEARMFHSPPKGLGCSLTGTNLFRAGSLLGFSNTAVGCPLLLSHACRPSTLSSA